MNKNNTKYLLTIVLSEVLPSNDGTVLLKEETILTSVPMSDLSEITDRFRKYLIHINAHSIRT
jgi:hypothetical protein